MRTFWVGLAVLAVVVAGLLLWRMAGERAAGGRLAEVVDRGALRVAVRAEAAPFAFDNAMGEPVGLEPALGADLARQLRVRFSPVVLAPDEVPAALAEGRVDVAIAGPLPQEAVEAAGAVAIAPAYFASGLAALAPAAAGLEAWEELSGQTVCVLAGLEAAAARDLAEDLAAEVSEHPDAAAARAALADGACLAWVGEEARLAAFAAAPSRRRAVGSAAEGVEEADAPVLALPPRQTVRWHVLAPADDARWLDLLTARAAAWHAEGRLVALSRAFGLAPPVYLLTMAAEGAMAPEDPTRRAVGAAEGGAEGDRPVTLDPEDGPPL